MAEYPMNFTANTTAAAGIPTPWTATTGDNRTLDCSVPKEFSGPGLGFSPEDLFILALINCYIATFKVIAANSKFNFGTIEGHAKLTLDRDTGAPTPWMKEAELHFTLLGVENEDKALRLLERVSKQCMVVNSVKTKVTFKFRVAAS